VNELVNDEENGAVNYVDERVNYLNDAVTNAVNAAVIDVVNAEILHFQKFDYSKHFCKKTLVWSVSLN
jgi:hypothetical protein